MTRDLLLVIISLATWGIGEGAFMYFQPLYLEELGASPVIIGAILGGVGLAMTVLHIPAGILADRIGRRQLMWAGWLTGILTTGVMALAKTLAVFSIGYILYAFTLFVIAPMNSYITAARNKLTVEQAMTSASAAFYFGGILGPLIGGSISEHLGLRYIYYFSFVVFIISGLVVIMIKPQPTEKGLSNPAGDLLKNRNFMAYMPYVFLVLFTLFFSQSLAPNFLKNIRGISLQTIGILGAVTNLGNVLLNIALGYLPTALGLVLGQLSVGVFASLIWKTTQLPILYVAYFLLGGYRATKSLVISQVGKAVNEANLGLAYGIAETVAGLSLTAAPPLAGILYSMNPSSIFSATLLLLVPSLLFTYLRMKLKWKT